MTLTAVCHCGATRIQMDGPPGSAKTCNCTYCQRVGAIWGYYPPEAIRITATEDRVYSPSGMNAHHFCGRCGSNTHGDSPDWASAYDHNGQLKPGMQEGVPDVRIAAVNLNMVDGLDLSTLKIEAMDGRNNW